MTEGKLFTCPSCGSSLSPQGDAAEIKCEYCGNTIIVPKGLRSSKVMVQTLAPKSQSGGLPNILIVAFGLAILLAVIGFGVVLINGSPPPVAKPTSRPSPSPTPAGFAHVVLSFGGVGTAPGLFQDARHVAVDANDNMYVAEFTSLHVQKFDPTGKYVSSWNVDPSLCRYTGRSVDTLAADRAGNVFVVFCGAILKYDSATGKLLAQFNGDNNSQHDYYMNEVLYPDGGMLVLANGGAASDNEVLVRLDATGKALARYPNPVTAQSGSPAHAGNVMPAMDGLGNIFLLNQADSTIYRFTPDGKYVNKFGSVGGGTGQFDVMALHIAVDNQSRVYVVDFFSDIKVFDSNGAYLDTMRESPITGIEELRINDKNEMYVVNYGSMIYKLALNKP